MTNLSTSPSFTFLKLIVIEWSIPFYFSLSNEEEERKRERDE
jgi:hypothetical protein